MRKKSFYLLTLLCSMTLFTACSDDAKPETPPTVEDIVAEYSSETLKPTIEGVEVAVENVKVELAKSEIDEKVTVILHNVVPGVSEFKIPDVAFTAITRSAYISTLKGEVTDNISGYKVEVDGTVDNKILTIKISLTEIEGKDTNTSSLYASVYKGNMSIRLADMPDPVDMIQRVYIFKSGSAGTTKRDTSMVKLTIENFAFQDLVLGRITLDTVLVQKRGEVLAFKAHYPKLKIATLGEVAADLKGTIVDKKMNLSLDIDAFGLTVAVSFDGESVIESKVAKMEEMKIEGPGIVGRQSTASKLTLQVWDDVKDSELLLTPIFKLSEKATVDSVTVNVRGQKPVKLTQDQVEGKAPIDFSVLKGSKDFIKYFLAAEDPKNKGSYLIYMERLASDLNTHYDMQGEWVDKNPKGLASSNAAAGAFFMMGITLPAPGAPVTKTDDGAARITTFKSVSKDGFNSAAVPALTAGTLFLGNFKVDMNNTLKSTKFGVPYRKKPTTLKFAYKYIPGETVYKSVTGTDGKNRAEVLTDRTDECSIAAYLYEVDDYAETLDGTNINNSKKVILKAELADGTAKTNYTEQSISFEEIGNGSYDATKKYKLTIVCSSSKWGAEFIGADLSSLYVKYLTVE